MIDKQIIIDGVNIAECPHRKKEVTFMNVIKCYNYGACEGVNCLYKQLKRKEQECEKLKKAIRLVETSRDKWEYIAKNKERECQDLQDISIKKCPKCGEVYLNSICIKVFDQLTQLKDKLLDQEAEILKAGEIIETLTKENEQSKKQACGLRPELKYIINKTCFKYNINAKYYHEKIVEIIKNLDKYKQTLAEIKEIADKDFRHTAWEEYAKQLKQILQKISECEVKNEN